MRAYCTSWSTFFSIFLHRICKLLKWKYGRTKSSVVRHTDMCGWERRTNYYSKIAYCNRIYPSFYKPCYLQHFCFFTILHSFIFIFQSPKICIHSFVHLCSFFHKEFTFVNMICGRAKKETNKLKKFVSCNVIPYKTLSFIQLSKFQRLSLQTLVYCGFCSPTLKTTCV